LDRPGLLVASGILAGWFLAQDVPNFEFGLDDATQSFFLSPSKPTTGGLIVKRQRRLTSCSGRTTPWFSDTKWKFGGVTIDADDDPTDAMSSPAKSCI
jgi:hypothetical protein